MSRRWRQGELSEHDVPYGPREPVAPSPSPSDKAPVG